MADQITVSLPDGSARTLENGTTTADLAASIGRKPRRRRGRRGRRRRRGRSRHPADRRRIGRHHHHRHRRGPARVAPLDGARARAGRHPAVARRQVLDRPGRSQDGFYYDFDLPGGAHFVEDDLARIEERMREIVQGRSALRARSAHRSTKAWRCSPTSPTSAKSSRASRRRPKARATASSPRIATAPTSSTCAAARTSRRPASSATSS